MWNDAETLRTFNWWLGWTSIAFILLGGVGVTAAKLLIDRRINALERERGNQLKQQLEDSRRRVTELEERQRPRTIDAADADRLVLALRQSPSKGIVIGTVNEREAIMFGEQIRHIFERADWKIIDRHTYMDVLGTGVAVVVKDASRPPPGTEEIRSALHSTGIEVEMDVDESITMEEYPVLFVGSKY